MLLLYPKIPYNIIQRGLIFLSQTFFKLEKTLYDGELWIIPGDIQNMAFSDSEILPIFDGGDYLIAAIGNYSFYLHGQNPAYFRGFLRSQI